MSDTPAKMTLAQAAEWALTHYNVEIAPASLRQAANREKLRATNTQPGSNRGEWRVTEQAMLKYLLTSKMLRKQLTDYEMKAAQDGTLQVEYHIYLSVPGGNPAADDWVNGPFLTATLAQAEASRLEEKSGLVYAVIARPKAK